MDIENFNLINDQIKAFISTYQENPFITPLKRIVSLHKRLKQSLKGIDDAKVLDILEKMENATDAICAGTEDMLHSTDKQSYHILLWELHQYLIKEIFPSENTEA